MGGSVSKDSIDFWAKKSASTKELPDAILNMIFSKADFRDILQLSTPANCPRYVFLTKDALDKLFREIRVEPKSGVGIFFAPVEDLTLSRRQDPSQAERIPARNMNCMKVAFFYIRIFQIYAALALTMLDTNPTRTLSIQGAATTQARAFDRTRPLIGGAVLAGEDKTVLEFLPRLFRNVLQQDTNQKKYIQNYGTNTNEIVYIDSITLLINNVSEIKDTSPIEFELRYYNNNPPEALGKGTLIEEKFTAAFHITKKQEENRFEGKLYIDGNEIPPLFEGTVSLSAPGARGGIQQQITWRPDDQPGERTIQLSKSISNQIYNYIKNKIGIPITALRGPIAQQPAVFNGRLTYGAAPAAYFPTAPSTSGVVGAALQPQQVTGVQATGIAGAPAQTGSVAASEFVGLKEVEKKLLTEKLFPKAYAIARAMQLLNPATGSEVTKQTLFTSDVCRSNRTPMDFDARDRMMPMINTQSAANIYFKSLRALYYDKQTILPNGQMVLEQTPPGREGLMRASQQLGALFHLAGGPQQQIRFLYDNKPIPPLPVCVYNGKYIDSVLQIDKTKSDGAATIKALQARAKELFTLQDEHNKSAQKLLSEMFEKKDGTLKLRKAIYDGGIPKVNELAEKARNLLLSYYTKAEAHYTLGYSELQKAQQKGVLSYGLLAATAT